MVFNILFFGFLYYRFFLKFFRKFVEFEGYEERFCYLEYVFDGVVFFFYG